MITELKDLPANVIGFIFNGKITGKDYEEVIFPALKHAAENSKKIRFIMVLGDLHGIDLKAMADDAWVGIKYFRNWERIAIVSDHSTMNHLLKAFSILVPGEMKLFSSAEEKQAIEWVSSNTAS